MRNCQIALGSMVVLTIALSGCSLLENSSIENHPCGPGPEYACLPGYACNLNDVCVTQANAQCNGTNGADPACGMGQECIRQRCVGICNGLTCPPSQTCMAETCQPSGTQQKAGSPCERDADCNTGLFCLQPYTGGPAATGVCTTGCTKSPDSCAEFGETCTTFPSDTPTSPDTGIDLCAAPGLVPCKDDHDCQLNPSSTTVCGILHGNTPMGAASAAACVSPIQVASGGQPGITCTLPSGSLSAAQCTTGLCIINDKGTGATNRYCTLPCGSGDCTALGAGATCTSVAIVQQPGVPITRAQVCILGNDSIGKTCTTGATCSSDAPVCVPAGTTVPDAGPPDSGPPDAGLPTDAGDMSDAGLDAGAVDAGLDAGPEDAGPVDAGPVDAGHVDAGPLPDAGSICAPFCTNGMVQCPIAGPRQLTCITESGNANDGVCH